MKFFIKFIRKKIVYSDFRPSEEEKIEYIAHFVIKNAILSHMIKHCHCAITDKDGLNNLNYCVRKKGKNDDFF